MEKTGRIRELAESEWSKILLIVVTLFGLFAWTYAESRSDYKELKTVIEENKRESNQILMSIQQEIKDFHGRLCAIEEKIKG